MSRNPAIEGVFGVIAGAEALLVGRVDLAVVVVIETIAASVDFALACRDLAEITAAPGGWVARLAAGAERVVGRGFAGVQHGVAAIGGASYAVVADGRRSGDTTLRGAGLVAIAEEVIVAERIILEVVTRAVRLVAGVERAHDAVIAVDGHACGAPCGGIADFDAIAGEAIVADRVVGREDASACLRIAGIDGAGDAIVTGNRRAWFADDVAGLNAVACVAVIALRVVLARLGTHALTQDRNAELAHGTLGVVCCRSAGAVRLVAGFDCASDAVARAAYARAIFAARWRGAVRIADLDPIADEPIAAYDVVWRVHTFFERLGASVRRARETVIADDGRSRLASDADVARLASIAIKPVVTGCAVWEEGAAVRRFVARIDGAADAVIAGDWRSGQAAHDAVAGLDAIAEQTIGAFRVVWDVGAGVRAEVAEIVGARHVVIAVERRSSLAACERITNLDAIAGGSVAAKRVVWLVGAAIERFIAGIDRAADSVITRRAGAYRTACAG